MPLARKLETRYRFMHHTMMLGPAAYEKMVPGKKGTEAGLLLEKKNQGRSFNEAGFLERPSSWETWVATSSMDFPAVETMGIWWL